MPKTTRMLLACALFPLWCMLAQQLSSLLMDLFSPIHAISPALAIVVRFVYHPMRIFLVFLYVVAAPGLFAIPAQEDAYGAEPVHTQTGRLPGARQILAALAAGALLYIMNSILTYVLALILPAVLTIMGSDFEYSYVFLPLLASNLSMSALYLLTVWLLVTFTHGKHFAQAGPEQADLGQLCRAVAVAVLAVVCLNNIWFYGSLAFERDVWSPSLFNLFGLRDAGIISNLNWGCFAAFTFLLWGRKRTGDDLPCSGSYKDPIPRGY